MKYLFVLIFMFLVGCGGSGGGSGSPAFAGSYRTSCQVSGSDSWIAKITYTASTMTEVNYDYIGSTTCSGTPVESAPQETSFTVTQSSDDVFEITTVHGSGMIKVIAGGLVHDTFPLATYDPNWDHVAEGTFFEYIRD